MASIEREVENALLNVVSGITGVNFFTSERGTARTMPSVTVQAQIGSEELVPFSGVFKTPATLAFVARADTISRADFDAKFYDILEQLYRDPDLASYLTDHSNITFYVAKVTGDTPAVISQNRTWSRTMTLDIMATAKKPFSPADISGLSLWLKADAGVTLSDSNVTAWADQSGNGRNATPDNPTDKPLFNASDKNGKPTISLTSMSDEVERVFTISSNPLGASGSTAFSVQYVEDVCDASNDNGPIFGNFGGSEIQSHYPYGQDCLVYDSFATTSRKTALTPPTTISDAWSIYSVHSTNGEWKDYVNGQLMHSDSSNTYNNSIGGDDATLYIGKQTGAGNFTLKGKVAEVIVYNRVLTTQERQQVEAYLNSKYAIY